MSTKDFSSIQESTIAKYLGWKVVAGSGAAACYPGDIKSEEFLGECKTHVKPGHKLIIDSKVWKKICEEAIFESRWPVLFIDDGSQNIKKTWCIFSPLSVKDHNIHESLHRATINQGSVSLDEGELSSFYKNLCLDTGFTAFTLTIAGSLAYLMPLSKFKQMLEE